jgi:phytoene dehydrogenase-like protein
MKANVTQILTEGGKVTGVRVGSKGNSVIDIHAPIVISDAGEKSMKRPQNEYVNCDKMIRYRIVQHFKRPASREHSKEVALLAID